MSGAGSVSDTRIPRHIQFDYIKVKKATNGTYTVDFSVNKRERIIVSIQGILLNTFEVDISTRSEDILGQWYLVGTTKSLYEGVYNYRACTVMTVFRHGISKDAQFFLKQSKNLGNHTFSIVDYPIVFNRNDTFQMRHGARLNGLTGIESRRDNAYRYRIIYFHSGLRSVYFLHVSSADDTEQYVFTDDAAVVSRRERRLVERVFQRYFKQLGFSKTYSVIATDLRCYTD